MSGDLRRSTELAETLGVSQPTMSRLLKKLGPTVLRVGNRRSTRYIGRRSVRGVTSPIPVYEVSPQGTTQQLASLHPVGELAHWVEQQDGEGRLHGDLPFFLDGMRPAGFLGRFIPEAHRALGNPDDIRHWSGDDTLRYLSKHSWDGMGSLIVGDDSLQQYLNAALKGPPVRISVCDAGQQYEQIIGEILESVKVGSSAGGEQPKFLAFRSEPERQCLVKFTPHLHEVGRRIKDLMVCEHLALEEIQRAGFSAAQSNLVEGKDRLFLEITRFDRTAQGRLGLVSLEALDSEYERAGQRGEWFQTCLRLARRHVIPVEALDAVQFLSAFGRLIGNTDMHDGNLSFFMTGMSVTELAPAYDMLPMMYQPTQGHLRSPPLKPPIPLATDSQRIWKKACEAGLQFWQNVSQHPLVSKSFQALAQTNERIVMQARSLGDKLPS